MRNDELSFVKELIGNAHTFIQQSAGILTEVENEAFQISKLVERFLNFLFRGLVKSGDVHVTDAGTNQEMQVNAIARNLIAYHSEFNRLLRALAQNRNV